MAAETGISWADSTFNAWIGCQVAGPGCDHCYAKTLVERWGGDFAARRRTSKANWKNPGRWERAHAKFEEDNGHRRRVFCSSLADVFDNQVPTEWRDDLWALIRATPNLDWMILTKRIGNVLAMLPPDWGEGWPNVWIGATITSQEEADRDIPKLLRVPAKVRWLSMEPLLGPVDLSPWLDIYQFDEGSCWSQRGLGRPISSLDWIVVGGESGAHARPMHGRWVRSLRDQCAGAKVPFHFKQWGEWQSPEDGVDADASPSGMDSATSINLSVSVTGALTRIGKKAAGRTLDAVVHDGYPA